MLPPHAAPRAPAPHRAVPPPAGWEDLSRGTGACVVRRLTPRGENTPPPGAVCTVRWTAWLATRENTWWARGERVGLQQPNATLEFTLGGGASEATRAWDAAVATMAPGDRVEVVARPAWAFGDGAEPHVPKDATVVFELILDAFDDWAENLEVFGEDRADDDDDELLRRELELAAEARKSGDDGGPQGPTAAALLDDLAATDDEEEPKVVDFAESAKAGVAGAAWPRGGGIDGETGKGVRWRETEEGLELEVPLPAPAASAKSVAVDFAPRRLAVKIEGEAVLAETLEGHCVPDDCAWALSEDRATLEVALAKRRPGDGAAWAVWAGPFASEG